MTVTSATIEDLQQIMNIEAEGFEPQIQETEATFEKRIKTFPDGFLLLKDGDRTLGYFSSELWESVPIDNKIFSLGHDIEKVHTQNGTVLYISSVAILKSCRGNGTGKKFFNTCMNKILEENPQIANCILLVHENWISAQKIYKSFGFIEYGKISNFFFDGNAILMKMKIQ